MLRAESSQWRRASAPQRAIPKMICRTPAAQRARGERWGPPPLECSCSSPRGDAPNERLMHLADGEQDGVHPCPGVFFFCINGF